ncbi:Alcohol dehydrogenase superfamily zinc-type [Penicillium paradoxum]|uniref:Alcohol dehydrogenase superfamily zinc-type n=1 Tax=Penicillium paradoxum TaxID=176176 RepID=UPI002549AD89|nr:Alcohol dehydrogenase superfamily zinc-type [Penicillium paradoxum]KAJ5773480.1 Alcohol dehydrogenase superfamily zinc-type [Penicillium paradoxum]
MGLSYNVYLTANKIFGCKGCKTHLADYNDIISRNFRGQHGKAYLFNTVVNVTQREAVERSMTTGRHIVRDIACRQCHETVGWKYDKAYESSEKYKEGKFILEEELLCVVYSGMMQAVVFHGPYKVAVEQRPIPKVQNPEDVVVKVGYTALCGSELHMFRGVEPAGTGFVMGHEFVGEIVEMGSAVKTLQKGDRVVTAFTTSCGECFYCKQGWSSRCDKNGLFGCDSLDGGQAEYARIPNAEGSVMKAPEGVDEKYLVLMGDIFPTGWFAAHNAFKNSTPEQIAQQTVVLIGCGPVGLCALINALEYKPKHILAVDSVPSRLELAQSLGAEPWNFQLDRAGLDKRVRELTNGRGADAIIEVVGLSPALRTGFELVRPFGTISSVGVHNGEIPWDGNDAYSKNLTVQMGRCPVRSVAPQALEVLKKNQHKLGFMADKIMPLSQAVEGYELFNAMKVQKVIFQADQ